MSQSTDKGLILKNLESTQRLGACLVKQFSEFEILLLKGPLGAGKTALVQGIANGLEICEPITSPTFALSQHYQGRHFLLVHIDLYRLEDPDSANELFLQEEEEALLHRSILAIEWPERLELEIPDAWIIELDYEPNGGRIAYIKRPQV